MTKQSDLATLAHALHLETLNIEEWLQTFQKSTSFFNSSQLDSTEMEDISVSINAMGRLVSQLSVRNGTFCNIHYNEYP